MNYIELYIYIFIIPTNKTGLIWTVHSFIYWDCDFRFSIIIGSYHEHKYYKSNKHVPNIQWNSRKRDTTKDNRRT